MSNNLANLYPDEFCVAYVSDCEGVCITVDRFESNESAARSQAFDSIVIPCLVGALLVVSGSTVQHAGTYYTAVRDVVRFS